MNRLVPTCCVFVPVHTLDLRKSELAALTVCMRRLKNYDFVFVYKSSLNPDLLRARLRNSMQQVKGSFFIPVADQWLLSVASYNRMMLSPWFYQLFLQWDYILVFQLDAWILKAGLDAWLAKRLTYIGAPWYVPKGKQLVGPAYGVGNGGLSLRNVKEMLHILTSPRFVLAPVYSVSEIAGRSLLFSHYSRHCLWVWPFVFMIRMIRFLPELIFFPMGFRNCLRYYANSGLHEDIVLGLMAPRVFNWMRMPSVSEAAHFSVETYPKETMKKFSVSRPFGCHAWEKYDRQFFCQEFPGEFPVSQC